MHWAVLTCNYTSIVFTFRTCIFAKCINLRLFCSLLSNLKRLFKKITNNPVTYRGYLTTNITNQLVCRRFLPATASARRYSITAQTFRNRLRSRNRPERAYMHTTCRFWQGLIGIQLWMGVALMWGTEAQTRIPWFSQMNPGST